MNQKSVLTEIYGLLISKYVLEYKAGHRKSMYQFNWKTAPFKSTCATRSLMNSNNFRQYNSIVREWE